MKTTMIEEKLKIAAGWYVGDTVSGEWFHVMQGETDLH